MMSVYVGVAEGSGVGLRTGWGAEGERVRLRTPLSIPLRVRCALYCLYASARV
jgi:hypothetical protein